MNEKVQLRVDLGISAAKIIQQVEIHNQNVADLVAKGVQEAVDELCKGDTIVLMAKEQTLKELRSIITGRVMTWETRQAIMTKIDEKVQEHINDYANKIAAKITEKLNDND